jgi:hypothetical protein
MAFGQGGKFQIVTKRHSVFRPPQATPEEKDDPQPRVETIGE